MVLTLAEAWDTVGKYEKAVGPYRVDLAIYRRIERYDSARAGRTMLGLGLLLLARDEPTDRDYEEGEELLLEALEVFEEGGTEAVKDQQDALEALQRLYGAGVWEDAATLLEEINARLAELAEIVPPSEDD